MLEALLQEVGLSANESAIYLTLLQYPGSTYNQLAKLSQIQRTTCYAVCGRLTALGLIKEDLGKPIVRLNANPPTALTVKLQREQTGLLKKIELTKRLTTELSRAGLTKKFVEPNITVTEEAEIGATLEQRVHIWDQSVRQNDGTVWGFQDSIFEKKYADFLRKRRKMFIQNEMQVKLFSDDPSYSTNKEIQIPSVDIRYLPQMVNFTASVYAQGDYVIMLSIQERPHYMLEIHEPVLAGNLRKYFNLMWEMGDSFINSKNFLSGLNKTTPNPV